MTAQIVHENARQRAGKGRGKGVGEGEEGKNLHAHVYMCMLVSMRTLLSSCPHAPTFRTGHVECCGVHSATEQSLVNYQHELDPGTSVAETEALHFITEQEPSGASKLNRSE